MPYNSCSISVCHCLVIVRLLSFILFALHTGLSPLVPIILNYSVVLNLKKKKKLSLLNDPRLPGFTPLKLGWTFGQENMMEVKLSDFPKWSGEMSHGFLLVSGCYHVSRSPGHMKRARVEPESPVNSGSEPFECPVQSSSQVISAPANLWEPQMCPIYRLLSTGNNKVLF